MSDICMSSDDVCCDGIGDGINCRGSGRGVAVHFFLCRYMFCLQLNDLPQSHTMSGLLFGSPDVVIVCLRVKTCLS